MERRTGAMTTLTVLERGVVAYDVLGRPIDARTFSNLMSNRNYQIIARTRIRQFLVSTVWVGTDHYFGSGPHQPLIFETMIFDEARLPDEVYISYAFNDGEYCRYPTIGQALDGHAQIVRHVKASLTWWRRGIHWIETKCRQFAEFLINPQRPL